MQWATTERDNVTDARPSCSCCSVAQTIALSLNSNIIHLPPLRRFPKANTAIVLPVIFGNSNADFLSVWLAHHRRVLGVDLIIVYSLNATETFDRSGSLRSFYELDAGRGAAIVNMPQIQSLDSHYHHQHFVINNALLRSIGAVQYLGSFDADEFLDIPRGHNITSYLQAALALQCHTNVNANVNTDVNTDVNTNVNTSLNTNANTDVNTNVNTSLNTNVSTNVNTNFSTNFNTSFNTSLNTDVTAPSEAAGCTSHKFAALSVGSLMINSYFTGLNQDALARVCTSGYMLDYSYLPPRAECHDDKTPEVRAPTAPSCQNCAMLNDDTNNNIIFVTTLPAI